MIIIFFIIGITNSVNFTDGLDGLVAGSSAISFGGILIISFWIYRHPTYYSNFIGDDFLTVELSLLISAVAGACLGFLWWNTNPAKIIMGDVGSHFLGSLFPLILFALGADGLIFFFCFLFILEGVSVVVQILSFKYRQKRVFKMAPIPSFKILYKQDAIPKADITVKAIGYQWYWGYEYPDENIFFDSYMIETKDLKENEPRLLAVDNELVVPVNKVVKVMITANDVLHG